MDIGLLSVLVLVAIVLLSVMGLPLAFSLGGTAMVLILYEFGELPILAINAHRVITDFALLTVPMIVLWAALVQHSGIARDLRATMDSWVRSRRRGRGVLAILAYVVLAALAGGTDTVRADGSGPPPGSDRERRLAIGVLAAGGAVGAVLPPSLLLVFFGVAVNVSIGTLFLAALLPGLMLACVHVAYIRRLGARTSAAELSARRAGIRGSGAPSALKAVVAPVLVLALVLGSIFIGIATPSEATALGVAGVLLLVAIRGELTARVIRESLRQSMLTLGQLMWLLIGALSLSWLYNVRGGPTFIADMVLGLERPLFILLLLLLLVFLLGSLIQWIAVVFLAAPLLFPIIASLGFDPVWFGVIFCMSVQAGALAPPFGAAAYQLKAVVGDAVPLAEVFRSLVPFLVLQALVIGTVVAFPELVLWLPDTMGFR